MWGSLTSRDLPGEQNRRVSSEQSVNALLLLSMGLGWLFLGCLSLSLSSQAFVIPGTVHPGRLATGLGASAIAVEEGLKFRKYEGLGNDFILVDNRESSEPVLGPSQSAQLCDRRFGIGGDGVIFALPGQEGADYTMRIYNSDGSEPEMCGNGIRCLARFLAHLEGVESGTYKVQTNAGVMIPVVNADGQVTVDMGQPELVAEEVPTTLAPNADRAAVAVPLTVAGRDWEVTAVSMGNPHAVVFVDDLDEVDLPVVGPQFETNAVFPAKTNTEFVQVLSRTHLKMKVWERGCGITLACGTGACALAVAACLNGLADRSCTVTLPGGDLMIEWRESNNHVYMTGPATLVFEGEARR